MLGVNGEQIAEAVPLMSVQGLDTFDLLERQTTWHSQRVGLSSSSSVRVHQNADPEKIDLA